MKGTEEIMADIIFSIFILAIFYFIIFYNTKRSPVSGRDDLLKRLNSMRGIFAVEIVIGHVVRYENTILYPLGKFMIISVAFFFFVSAFGMVISFQEKDNYLKGFLLVKLPYIFALAVITFAVNVCMDLIYPKELGYCFKKGNLIFHFLSVTNWYLWELALFYIVFFIVYKYIKKYRILTVSIITTLFIGIIFQFGWKTKWYASAMAFPVGLAMGEYYLLLIQLLRSKKGKIVTIALTVMGLSSLLYGEKSLVGMVYMKNAMCLAGLCILLYFSMNFVIGNKFNVFLGRYSTEIYLFQFVYLNMAGKMQLDWKMQLIIVVISTLLTACIMHPLFNIVKLKIGYIKYIKL